MSVCDRRQVKVTLPRSGCGPFWRRLLTDARKSPAEMRLLMMLALRYNSGWSIDDIAALTGRHKGQVSRLLKSAICRLRERYQDSPEVNCSHGGDDGGEEEEGP